MAKEYDLEQDAPYGVASADFPVTFFDRPQLMFSNLLRGDVDGMTRAMLSPSTMSPQQMKDIRDMLMPGKKVNPILRTIMDVATNPLVIIGLAAGLWKFPVGTTAPILALRRGLMSKAAAMGPLMDGLHDAFMNLRHIPGLAENMLKVTKGTTDFMAKHYELYDDIFQKAGKVSKVEGYQIAAKLDGLDRANHYMVKLLRNEPEYIAFMGGKDVPIANLEGTMSQTAKTVANRMRGLYNNIWSDLTGDPVVAEKIKMAVEKKGLQYGDEVDSYLSHAGQYDKYYGQSLRGVTGVRYRRWMEKEVEEKIGREFVRRKGGMVGDLDHLRDMESLGTVKRGFSDMTQQIYDRWTMETSQTVQSVWGDIQRLGLDDSHQRSEFVRRIYDHYTTGAGKGKDVIARFGNKRRMGDTFDAMAGALQDAKIRGADAVQAEFTEIGRTLAVPGKYTLNVWDSTGRYINSVASSYAWHGTGHGEAVMKIVNAPDTFRGTPHLESYVMDNLLPYVRGLKSDTRLHRDLSFMVQKEKIHNWVRDHPLVEKTLGSDRKKWVLDYLDKPVFSSAESVGAGVARYFHLSTLGLNLASSAKNSLQTLVTTINAPGIGPRGIWRGLTGFGDQEGLLVKMGRYVNYRFETGMTHAKAFNRAFPEFVADAGDASQIVSSMLHGDIAREGYVRAFQGGGMKAVEKFLMAPFQTTESGNRLLAYYAGRNSHLFHNAERYVAASAGGKAALLKEAGEVGQSLNMLANFTGGPLGIPKALINMNPVWRQFAQFPMRLTSFLHGSLRMGADPNKLDWGTMGRALAGSTATYLAARNMLGVDLSGGLLMGALPLPQYEKSPFYPFPVVPPAAQLIGTGVMALAKGDMEGLAESAGLLVPGGVAAKRAYQTLSPHYADYTNPTPDGRIPLYSRNKSLIGTLTPMELTLRAIGLRPTNVSAEVGAAKWLLSQRDRIRQYRRDYTEALAQNDMQKAEKVNAEFQKVYPELGPLQIKKSDLRALENRKQISRLTRIEKGFPTAYRPLFSQVISEAGLGAMVEDIETGGGGLQDFLPPQ